MVFVARVYQDRLKRVREIAASRGFSGLILTRPSSIVYIAGFVHMPMAERPLYAVIPIDNEPFLLVPAIEFGHARAMSWFKDVRHWYFDVPSKTQPFSALAKMLTEAKLAGKTIGVEEAPKLAWKTPQGLDILKKEMPETKFVIASDIVHDMRMIKSKEEIELMRHGASYSDFAMSILKETIREGLSELEVVGKVTYETLSSMAKDTKCINIPISVDIRVVSGPRSAFAHTFATTNTLKRGDVIMAWAITFMDGYECGELVRTFFLGKPKEEQVKIYNTAIRGFSLAREAMKPGATCSEVHKASYEYLVKSGYKEYIFAKTGSMRGLEMRDGIYLSEVDDTILRPGMTFSVQAGICIPGNGGYRLTDMTLVTEKGCESLQQFPRDVETVTIEA